MLTYGEADRARRTLVTEDNKPVRAATSKSSRSSICPSFSPATSYSPRSQSGEVVLLTWEAIRRVPEGAAVYASTQAQSRT